MGAGARQPGRPPGFDGGPIDQIVAAEDGPQRLGAEWHEALRAKTYQPQPVRRVDLPKPNGPERPLGIPTVRDRVAQTAAVLVLEPIVEADCLPCSYGVRPKRSAHHALTEVQRPGESGQREIYDADLTGDFDAIPHDQRLRALAKERETLRALTSTRQCWQPIPALICTLNRHLAGWANYVSLGHPRAAFRASNCAVQQRFRAHLGRRSQRPYRLPQGQSPYRPFADLGRVYL